MKTEVLTEVYTRVSGSFQAGALLSPHLPRRLLLQEVLMTPPLLLSPPTVPLHRPAWAHPPLGLLGTFWKIKSGGSEVKRVGLHSYVNP